MKNSFFNSTVSRVVALLTFLTIMTAIIGGMVAFDDRYARADDVQKTQIQMLKSIKLINVSLELVTLKSRELELKIERRAMMLQIGNNPGNIDFKIMLEEINSDLSSVTSRICLLENTRIVE